MTNIISFYILACIFYIIIKGLNIEGGRVSFNKLADYIFLPSIPLIIIFVTYIKLKNNN